MKLIRLFLMFLWVTGFTYVVSNKLYSEAAPPPVLAGQPHSDQFVIAPYGNLDQYSPVFKKANLAPHTVLYGVRTEPGCSTGTIPQMLVRVETEALTQVHFHLVRNDSAPDFTVHIDCGSDQIRLCGAVTTFCLGYGFPYNNDVAISDILNTYTSESQLAIPLHEIMGHAVAVWNEQYCTGVESSGVCSGLSQFTPTPGWVDFMNTGVDSRHGYGAIERGRWERTMYSLTTDAPYINCTTYAGWEPTISCYWPDLSKWLWTIPTPTGDQLWEFSSGPNWVCVKGCP